MDVPESYTLVASLFPRLLGFIFFFAFGAFLFQIRGLIGREGILPLSDYLSLLKTYYSKNCYHLAPTLFWFNASDIALMVLVGTGTLLSVGLMAGICPPLLLFLVYVLYLSIISAGQDFLSFGWEGYLLEITVHAFFLSLTPVPNTLVWMSINFLLFRFHFQAGAVKLQSQDKSWRDLTAIAAHYQSQPLPNTMAWFAYKLPLWFQKMTCVGMFLVELVVPFGIFMSEDIRFGVAMCFIGLQLGIWFTGNFSFLNHLTIAFSTLLISNKFLAPFFMLPPESYPPTPFSLSLLLSFFGGVLLFLQVLRLWHHFIPDVALHRLFQWIAPYHLANRYGIFAVMTIKRYEIIVEGSEDSVHWKEYLFRWKPSEVNRRPRRISPYQPRLDWQAWFLPFDSFNHEAWFRNFLFRLLKGSKPVLALLRENPFPDHPPKYIRALVYDYQFSDWETRKKEGAWWTRTYVSTYSPPMSLKKNVTDEEE